MASSVVRVRLAATVSVLALGIAMPALAQSGQDSATTVDDIIVTAQKREESIQDVPIAVSAFSSEMLDALKIEGGSELLRAIPNVTFSKNNFSMYNFSIRGIGTKAISASSDPAVAVSFNNSPMIRNRLFESEYMDVNRVEVLRGPQGTLYGRNATAGVVNMIPNLPDDEFDAQLKGEFGNFGSVRSQLMVNIPLSDTFAVRAASSMTKRGGFDTNTFKDTSTNGRDLYSVRLSAAWRPTDSINASLIWERFGEDDDRSRTGKQLCTRDPGPSSVSGVAISDPYLRGRLSQGCKPGSLYAEDAYGAPNAFGLSQIFIIASMSPGRDINNLNTPLWTINGRLDPFAGVTQTKDLREIATSYDPTYRADNDIIQFNLNYKLSERFSIDYQYLNTSDSFRATQDYFRYVSNNIFNDNSWVQNSAGQVFHSDISPGGYFSDPQLGLSRRMESIDLSQSENSQTYHELRFVADVNDRFKATLGVNHLQFDTEDNYYVFNNTFTLISQYFYNSVVPNLTTLSTNNCVDGALRECVYVDLTNLGDGFAGDGHNYFRSKNVIDTTSSAVFGEAYIGLTETTNLTLGARYTSDSKVSTLYPSQLLLGNWDLLGFGPASGGKIARGYYALDDVKQKWDAVTGRVVFDWKPNDSTMAYVSYSRGYKGGGTNPPRADINPIVVQYQPLAGTFEPEYVDAFEVGYKASFYDGLFSLNSSAFFYDYEDYQVSQIVDRISLNENFDAISYGVEFEAVWRPTPNLRIHSTLGLLKTEIGEGEGSVDVMNRTQGNADWVVLRPWIQVPSNCIAPAALVARVLSGPYVNSLATEHLSAFCGGSTRMGSYDPNVNLGPKLWQMYEFNYNPFVDAPNGGRGFNADLSGNELPNAPNVTFNTGASYSFRLGGINMEISGDYYYQGSSYFRVYNTELDRLKGWGFANLSVSALSEGRDLEITAYVKNVFDDAPIVDAFVNSDDSMLTTNVFTLDPRVWGVSLTKRF